MARSQLDNFSTARSPRGNPGKLRPFSGSGSPSRSVPHALQEQPDGGAVHFAGVADFSRSSFSTPAASRFPRPTSTSVPARRRTIFQRKCEAVIRKWISCPTSATSLFSTTTSVDSWPSGFSQNDAKSCRPSKSFAARRIAAKSSRSLTHQTNGLSNAVRRREMR